MGGWSTLAVLKMKLLRAPPLTLLFGRWRGGCNATTKDELCDHAHAKRRHHPVKADLRGIAKAIYLSRATMRNPRQNLFFAFFYKAFGIPVAAGVLHPFFGLLLSSSSADAALSLSSVTVIGEGCSLKTNKNIH